MSANHNIQIVSAVLFYHMLSISLELIRNDVIVDIKPIMFLLHKYTRSSLNSKSQVML